MKVIDLLNKIANKEEIGKFKIMSMEYYIDDGNFLCDEFGRVEWFIDDDWLNMPVEIIEEEPRDIEVCGSLFTRSEYNRLAGIKEDKKIPEKLGCCSTDLVELDMIEKINEIIDYLDEEKQC